RLAVPREPADPVRISGSRRLARAQYLCGRPESRETGDADDPDRQRGPDQPERSRAGLGRPASRCRAAVAASGTNVGSVGAGTGEEDGVVTAEWTGLTSSTKEGGQLIND